MNLKEAKERYVLIGNQLEEMRRVVDAEQRNVTDGERESSVALMDEMVSLEKEIDKLEFEERVDATIQKSKENRQRIVKPSPLNIVDKKGFRNLGEFMQAVYVAGVSPRVDSRLQYQSFAWENVENRAASGLSQGIPADGGSA